MGLSAVLAVTAALAGVAHATPAAAVTVCSAPTPPPGAEISGPVLQVIDGRTFCLAEGPTPASWLKVTLAGSAGAGDRSDLMAAAFARRVTCVVSRRDDDGVLARCAIGVASDTGVGPRAASQTSRDADAANCPKPD